MEIEFCKIVKEAKYLDPTKDFKETTLPIEIRTDPLTKKQGRVVNFRFKLPAKPDFSELVERSKEGCPFCPENIERVTPQFLQGFSDKGRIKVGEAMVFPNSMPYASYNAITLLSGKHFVEIDNFDEELIVNSLLACQEYLKKVLAYETKAHYCSINWNYMPLAGAGLVHPHLQIIASDISTNYHKELITRSMDYYEKTGRNFWEDLIIKEKALEERYIGSTGTVHWLTSFVPKSMVLDVMAIFTQKDSFLNLQQTDLEDFSHGLKRVLNYFSEQNFYSFNMTIYSGLLNQSYFWNHARIVSRFIIPPAGTSDVNYLEKLHEEIFIVKSPEDTCMELSLKF